jgi:molecular chaperone DnaK
MAHILGEYFEKHGLRDLEAALRSVVGKPPHNVTNEIRYRQTVIRAAWNWMPLTVRTAGGIYEDWDSFCLRLRVEAFDVSGDAIRLRPDWRARAVALVQQCFGPAGDSPAAAGRTGASANTAPAPPQADVPLAVPVATPPGPPPACPIAPPVTSFAPAATPPIGRSAAAGPADRVQPNSCGQATDVAVGIDLGTTFSVVAYRDAQGRPCSIPNAAGDLLTPSVVLFDPPGTVVGKEAVLASAMEPEKVAECVKRDMGGKVYRKKINGKHLPPEVVSSLILRSLKTDAERRLGPVRRAVITVPAYFDETRRRATMDAGRLAGLEVLDIINEPTAAAIAYGYQLGFLDRACKPAGDRPLRVLVFDLGGGTFDVTIVEIRGRAFKALATDGDVNLGGKDWDETLVEIAADRFRQHFREDPRAHPVSRQELWLVAEAAKRTLTERPRAALFVNHLGSRLKVEVTREEFEEATAALLERTRLTTELVVRQAGLAWADIDRVLLVGGSTRMPMVVRMLEALAGKPPDRSVSPDEAVAHGAALYAELLAPRHGTPPAGAAFTVQDVNSHSLGVLGTDPATGRRFNKIILPKNSPLPRTVTKVFKTFTPNQRTVVIQVLEGEAELPEACSRVGVCTIRDLPPHLPAGWPVRVSYTYEANGRLHVRARLRGQRVGVTTDFIRENSLPDEELEMLTHYVEQELCGRP